MHEAIVMHNQDNVIELLQSHVQSQKDAIKTLENKAMYNLTIVNIIAGIVAALNLPFGAGEVPLENLARSESFAYFVATAVSIVLVALCAFVATLSIRTLWVRRLRTHPMQPNEQNALDWSACDPDYFSELVRKSYLQIYHSNAGIVDDKGSMVTWSHKAIVLIVILILFGSVVLGIEQFWPHLQKLFGIAS